MGKKEAILFLKLLKPCVTNVDQSIWNTMHSHIKITIKNQDREISHLIRNVLPPLFGETFSVYINYFLFIFTYFSYF